MEWIKQMSLKKSFFTMVSTFLFGGLLLAFLSYQLCANIIDNNGYYEIVYAMEENAANQVVIQHPQYEIWSFFQYSMPVACIIFSLVLSNVVFYNVKLKKPIAILQNSAERIHQLDLDFVVAKVFNDELGELSTAFEIMREELYKNNQELWRQMEERKRLNAAFSHNLRNPVTVVKGSAKMARQCAESGTERTAQLIENLTRIETYTGRIERYVEAMSSAGYLEQIQLEKTFTDPKILARELENAIRLVVADGGKQLSFTCTETVGKILLDKNVLFQIAENLVSNAIRFAKQTISVNLSFSEDMLLLEVADDGSGFPVALLKNGIQPFQKGNEDAEHFGMGLYICDLLCKKHGGCVKIKNCEQGASASAILKIS